VGIMWQHSAWRKHRQNLHLLATGQDQLQANTVLTCTCFASCCCTCTLALGLLPPPPLLLLLLVLGGCTRARSAASWCRFW
jgi:hypothetical protein